MTQGKLIETWSREPGRVERITVNGPDDGGLVQLLKNSPHLQKLVIGPNASVSAASYTELAKMEGLEVVWCHCHLTADVLKGLASLRQVRELLLDLSADRIDSDALRAFPVVDHVQKLTLNVGGGRWGEPDDKLGSALLSRFSGINELRLGLSGVGPLTLNAASQIPGIKRLNVSSPFQINQEFEALEGSATLEHFGCGNTGDIGLSHVSRIASLRSIGGLSKLTDTGMKHFENMPNLESITSSSVQITDSSLHHLKNLSGLRKLRLASPQIFGHGFKELTGLDNLQSLNLRLTSFRPENLQYLAKLNSLEVLDVATREIDAINHPEVLAVLRDAPKLKRLDVELFTAEDFRRVEETLPGVLIEYYE